MRHDIESVERLTYCAGDPLTALASWCAGKHSSAALLVVDFELEQYWLPGSPNRPLTAIYLASEGSLQLAVTELPLVSDTSDPSEQFLAWVQALSLAVISPGEALALTPRFIQKPWGQEIWFTGIEERGVCGFSCGATGRAVEVPIPWLQAAMPDALAGALGQPLVLLKILDPAAEAVVGDLYFELHEEKREVYVVTHVDRKAWPDGTGYIRFGFNPKMLDSHSDSEFRAAYLEAVEAYEAVRTTIDMSSSSPTEYLLQQEKLLREQMDRYTHMRPLRVGDVVQVPLLTPHSLQHGVRTIEFQTPVYERKILSFAQQVQTQGHWDTRAAVSKMQLRAPLASTLELLDDTAGVRTERIVDFADFEVKRVVLSAGTEVEMPSLDDYEVIIVVSGHLGLCDASYGAEAALFLPRNYLGTLRNVDATEPLILLRASPRG